MRKLFVFIGSTILTLLILPSAYLLLYMKEHFCQEHKMDESQQKSAFK